MANAWLRRACLFAALAMLGGCSSLTTADLPGPDTTLPSRTVLYDVPFFPQDDHYCGPAALATVLAWSGEAVSQTDLAPNVFTPGRQGTLRTDMLAAARRHGRLAVPIDRLDDLLTEIASGSPVLVFQNLGMSWFPKWHFAVAVGYDLQRRTIILRSGEQKERELSFEVFERTWRRGDRWGLVVLPPDRLPATASDDDMLHAAAGLERAGQYENAILVFTTLAANGPKRFPALMGIGNSHYALDQYSQAEAAFRKATSLKPAAPQGWNNLAYALAAQFKTGEAIDAAQRAVELAGPDAAAYRATLSDVSNDMRLSF